MKKRRVNWAFGNPACTAWEVETAAGLLVVRRNHALVRAGARWCQGWDVWLGGKFAGALSSRTLSDLATLSRGELLAVLRTACCGRPQQAIITCCAITFQRAFDLSRLLNSHRSCRAPIIVALGLSPSGQSGLLPSPQGWSLRYWRVSRTLNSARPPNRKRRYKCMSDRADGVADHKAVPIPSPRPQPSRLDMR
jgi:hypothetical protein